MNKIDSSVRGMGHVGQNEGRCWLHSRCRQLGQDLQEEGSEHADSYREPGKDSQKQDPKAGTCLAQAFRSFLAYKLLLHMHMQNSERVQPPFLCPVAHCLQPQAWQTLGSMFFP